MRPFLFILRPSRGFPMLAFFGLRFCCLVTGSLRVLTDIEGKNLNPKPKNPNFTKPAAFLGRVAASLEP